MIGCLLRHEISVISVFLKLQLRAMHLVHFHALYPHEPRSIYFLGFKEKRKDIRCRSL